MSDVQIAVIDQQDTQIVLAVPGVQGATGSEIPAGGTADQVLRKNSSTDYDANWSQVTSAMIANGTIVNDDVNNAAAIAGTKISPDFGGQAVTTTGQVNAARVNVTGNTEPTNGLYSPGANQVALSTNGTGRLFVDASGKVGINTSSAYSSNAPLDDLHIAGGNPALILEETDAGTDEKYWRIRADGSILRFEGINDGFSATTSWLNVTRSAGARFIDSIAFNTGADESLRITSEGLVGIGAGSPQTLLQLGSTTAADQRLSIFSLTSANDDAYGSIEFRHGVSSGNINSKISSLRSGGSSGGALAFYTRTQGDAVNTDGGQERLRITSNGELKHLGGGTEGSPAVYFAGSAPSKSLYVEATTGHVGIGTSSPDNLLHLAANNSAIGSDWSTAGNLIRIEDLDTTQAGGQVIGGIVFEGRDADAPGVQAALMANANSGTGGGQLRFYTAATSTVLSGTEDPRLLIDGSGNVGIGTTDPGKQLSIRSDSADVGISIGAGSNSFNQDIDFLNSLDNFSGRIRYYPADGAMSFWTSFDERARIDSSGRLLVGTPTSLATVNYFGTTLNPASQQAGNTNDTAAKALYFYGTSGNAAPTIALSRSNATSVGSHTIIGGSARMGAITFNGSDGTEFVSGAEIFAANDGTPGTNDMPGRLVFSTTADGASSPTERMRITSDGQIWTGNTASLGAAKVQSSSDSATAAYLAHTTSTVSRTHFRFINPNGEVGSITTSASATAYNTSSDYRLKENVTPVTDGITRLQQLKPSRFNFIADPTKTVDGFLAHEVQTIVPEAITGEKDAVDDEGNPEYQGIDQSKLVPLLTAALQEAIAKIETLEQRLNDAGIN